MRKKVRIGLMLLFVILAVLALGMLVVSSSSRSGLNRLKAELRAKGEKLLMTELAVALSTNAEEVACRELFATNTIPMPKLMPILMEQVSSGAARVAWRGGLKVDYNITGTWEELEAQAAQAEPSLKLFRSALEHPAPDSGWVYSDDFESNRRGPKFNLVVWREVAQQLIGAELCALHRGDLDGAFTNLHALAGMARLEKNDLALVRGMMDVTMAELGLKATWEAIQAPGWDEARLAQLQRDWEQFNALDAVERGVLGERAMNQSIMAWVRKAGGNVYDTLLGHIGIRGASATNVPAFSFKRFWNNQVLHTAYKLGGVNADELAQLQYYDTVLEGIRLLKANHGWAEVGNRGTNAQAELNRKMEKDRWHRLKVSAIIVPNLVRTPQKAIEVETLRRLTITALAIKRYELKYAGPPKALSVLQPEFLVEVPIDPMSGKALCYRLEAGGKFVLYSVGEDGKDDGGDGAAAGGLWVNRDAVWPAAAEDDGVAEVVQTNAKTRNN